ncbi:MAG: kynureninase [Bdellovibrionaceae bacterium]|nr:kynureninase [Bdellovibrio sp.]
MFQSEDNSKLAAKNFDSQDQLKNFRERFHFPVHNGQPQLYFAGHSLGLMPKKASEYVNIELQSWAQYGVEGHFKGQNPWLPYHENITASFAKLVGAKDSEVVAMNTLTVNLHLMMVSFYKPKGERNKILIENNTFPSDKYAVDSQARFHGLDPQAVIVELKSDEDNGLSVSEQSIIETIKKLGSSLSLVMLGNCNYLSGQKFNFQKIVEAARAVGAKVGFNLAHGAGNLQMQLHDWDVDFSVWCSYKYLNSGPGGLAGAFVHEKHHLSKTLSRFEGWWGHSKDSRFQMGPQFEAIPTIEAWQLSNPPILQLASLRASMEIFDEAQISRLRKKGDHLTSYFQWLIEQNLKGVAEVITPTSRGSMLCLKLTKNPKLFMDQLIANGAIVDFREPNIIRATPAPLYNSYEDVFNLVQLMKEISNGQ